MRAFTYRRLFIGLGIVLAVLLVLVVVAWWRLPDLLNLAARKWLPAAGFEEARVQINSAGFRSVELSGIAAAPGWHLTLGHARAEYSLAGLINRRKADLIIIEGLNLAVEMPIGRQENGVFSNDPDDAPLDPFDFSWLARWPSERIEVRDLTVSVARNSHGGTVQVNGTAVANEDGSLTVELQLAMADSRARLSGTLRPEETSQLKLSFMVPDFLTLIAQVIPDWREQLMLDPEVQLTIAETHVHAELMIEPNASFTVRGDLSVSALGGSFEDAAVQAENFQMSLTIDPLRRVALQWGGDAVSGHWDTLFLSANPFELSVTSDDLADWNLDWNQPLHWRYGESLAHGAVTASAVVSTADSASDSAFRVILESQDLAVGEQLLEPWQLTVEGVVQAFTFAGSPLRLSGYPEGGLEDVAGSVHFLSDEERLSMEVAARVAPDALSPWAPDGKHPEIFLGGNLQSDRGIVAIELRARTAGDASFPSVFSELAASGALTLGIEGRRDSTDGPWSGQLSVEGSASRISGNDWHSEGWMVSGQFSVPVLEVGQLSIAEDDYAGWIEQFGYLLNARASWQANGIYTDVGTAQWLSGEINLNDPDVASDEPFDMALTARAGIVQVLEESIQQADFSYRIHGNTASLSGAGSLDFWYGGSAGQLSFAHSVNDVFADPVLQGDYALSPFVFDYSDLAGRYFPQLESLSFSGILSAAGSFWRVENGVDAAVEVAFDQGAFDFPASQIAVEGVSARIGLTSLMQRTGRPGGSWLDVARINAGDLTAFNGRLVFSLQDANTLQLTSGGLEMFGGNITVDPAEISIEPLEFQGTVRFERLSLDALTAQMSFFDGTMEGTVSGFMPFHYAEGQLTPQQGLLELPEGETARLRYNSQGLFSSPRGEQAPESPPGLMDRISARLLRVLKLEPEKVVEDALADLLINQLRIELFPEETPDSPIRIQFAGEAESGGTRVPLHLKTNVNGTLDELYNFLIRLNSLGSTSF